MLQSIADKLKTHRWLAFLVLGVLAVAVLLLGLFPAPLLNIMDVSVHHLVQQAVHSKLPL